KLQTLAFAQGVALSHDSLWRSIFQRPTTNINDEKNAEKAKRLLGQLLFSDTRLSGNRQRACSSCHRPEMSFTDGRQKPLGLNGQSLERNTPHLWNLAEAKAFFWDGRAPTLQSQARFPLYATQELSVDMPRALQEFSEDATFVEIFTRAFPEEKRITEEQILEALVAYEKSLISPETRFDFWVRGKDEALSEVEKNGLKIFVGKGGCVSCHGGWRFTDDQFHDIGLESSDLGRNALGNRNATNPSFKTPSLRQISQTAPYMHDGSLGTLEDVILHYTQKITLRPSLSPTLVQDLNLDMEEKAALLAFLKTL
ncbi:MAG: cytochrome-c peroxidase, partial [Hyphomicrobium sp.]